MTRENFARVDAKEIGSLFVGLYRSSATRFETRAWSALREVAALAASHNLRAGAEPINEEPVKLLNDPAHVPPGLLVHPLRTPAHPGPSLKQRLILLR